MKNFETRNKTSAEQSYWREAEKDVLQYFLDNNCQAESLNTTDYQFDDCDIKVVFPDGQEHLVSVKYMPAVAKYCNLSFELATIDKDGNKLDGWFLKNKATMTAIVIPNVHVLMVRGRREPIIKSPYNRILLFSSSQLKQVVPRLHFKKTRLTDYQKQFNIRSGRKYIDAENLIVRLEDILPYAIKDVILKNNEQQSCTTTIAG